MRRDLFFFSAGASSWWLFVLGLRALSHSPRISKTHTVPVSPRSTMRPTTASTYSVTSVDGTSRSIDACTLRSKVNLDGVPTPIIHRVHLDTLSSCRRGGQDAGTLIPTTEP